MTVIRDPGTHNGANVTSTGKLETYGVAESEEMHENEANKHAYVMNLPAVILGAAWIWAVIKNSEDNDLVVSRVMLWTSVNKSNDFMCAFTRGTFTYASNGTQAVPASCNSGGALSAPAGDFYYNDAVGDMTTIGAGQECGSILATTTPTVFDISAKWVVPKNQVFYLKSELANDNTYKGWIEFYYHNIK